jgi:ribose 5-phosphate isomerase A
VHRGEGRAGIADRVRRVPTDAEAEKRAARADRRRVGARRHDRRPGHRQHGRALPPRAGRARACATCAAWRRRRPPSTRRASSAWPSRSFDRLERLDIAVDGADQIDPACWLSRAAAARTRARRSSPRRPRSSSSSPTRRRSSTRCARRSRSRSSPTARRRRSPPSRPPRPRDAPPSPDGGLIVDHHGDVDDPASLAARLSATPGVIDHGLFAPELVTMVLVGRGDSVERLAP